MIDFVPDTASSIEKAVGGTSTAFSAAMVPGQRYVFVSSTACWIAQGATPTASAGVGSMYVPAGVPVMISGSVAADLAVIQDSAGGKASLTHVFANL